MKVSSYIHSDFKCTVHTNGTIHVTGPFTTKLFRESYDNMRGNTIQEITIYDLRDGQRYGKILIGVVWGPKFKKQFKYNDVDIQMAIYNMAMESNRIIKMTNTDVDGILKVIKDVYGQ